MSREKGEEMCLQCEVILLGPQIGKLRSVRSIVGTNVLIMLKLTIAANY